MQITWVRIGEFHYYGRLSLNKIQKMICPPSFLPEPRNSSLIRVELMGCQGTSWTHVVRGWLMGRGAPGLLAMPWGPLAQWLISHQPCTRHGFEMLRWERCPAVLQS